MPRSPNPRQGLQTSLNLCVVFSQVNESVTKTRFSKTCLTNLLLSGFFDVRPKCSVWYRHLWWEPSLPHGTLAGFPSWWSCWWSISHRFAFWVLKVLNGCFSVSLYKFVPLMSDPSVPHFWFPFIYSESDWARPFLQCSQHTLWLKKPHYVHLVNQRLNYDAWLSTPVVARWEAQIHSDCPLLVIHTHIHTHFLYTLV